MQKQGKLDQDPIREMIASVSVGVVDGVAVLDLDYLEDSSADTDMNVVMDAAGGIIEVQGTAEGQTFSRSELDEMLDLATVGINRLVALQREALSRG
jgi:ribonuclease PH